MAKIFVERMKWDQWPEIASVWEGIHSLCPGASIFLSRDWVATWLEAFGERLKPDLLAFANDEAVVGCCLLVWRSELVRHIPMRRVYLNCAGEDKGESTCLEYNALLSLPEHAEAVAEALLDFLQDQSWDELLLDGMTAGAVTSWQLDRLGSVEVFERPAHYADLRELRRSAGGLDAALSAKSRKNIRRSQRSCEAGRGACTVRVAETEAEAVSMLHQLARLHQSRWIDRGSPGSFASPRIMEFHEAWIRRSFAAGRILLFQVQSGSEPIGLLYCFLDRGWVRFYQSGFNYSLDARSSPGLVTLYFVIRYCLEQSSLQAFDFLAGDSQYKRILANASQPLRWIIVRRFTASSLLYRGLRFVRRAYVDAVKEVRREDPPVRGS